jgi:hypothetical protein
MSSSLNDPKDFFTKYVNRFDIDIVATRRRENVTVYVKDSEYILGVFRKADLVSYYRSQDKYYRFNTCPRCNSVMIFEITNFYEIGEKPKDCSVELPITETENVCGREHLVFDNYRRL